jgi:hypothetical protein
MTADANDHQSEWIAANIAKLPEMLREARPGQPPIAISRRAGLD